MNKMHKSFTHAVVSKPASSEVQRDLCSSEIYANILLQLGHTSFDILGLILDKAGRTSIIFLYFGLIFTKLENPTPR